MAILTYEHILKTGEWDELAPFAARPEIADWWNQPLITGIPLDMLPVTAQPPLRGFLRKQPVTVGQMFDERIRQQVGGVVSKTAMAGLFKIVRGEVASAWKDLGLSQQVKLALPEIGAPLARWQSWAADNGLSALLTRRIGDIPELIIVERGYVETNRQLAVALVGRERLTWSLRAENDQEIRSRAHALTARSALALEQGRLERHTPVAALPEGALPAITQLYRYLVEWLAATTPPATAVSVASLGPIQLSASRSEPPRVDVLVTNRPWCWDANRPLVLIFHPADAPAPRGRRTVGPLEVVSPCGVHGEFCPGDRAGLRAMAELLVKKALDPGVDQFAAGVTAPAWTRALLRLESEQTADKLAGSLGWRIQLTPYAASAEPVVISEGKRGDKITKLSRKRLREWLITHPDQVLTSDLATAAGLRAEEAASDQEDEREAQRALLLGLVGHPRLMVTGETGLWQIDRQTAGVEVVEAVDHYVLKGIGPGKLDAFESARWTSWLPVVDSEKRQLTVLDLPLPLRRLAAVTAPLAGRLPRESAPHLLRTLLPLASQMALKLPASLSGQELRPLTETLVRLTPAGDMGLDIEIWVQPLADGPLLLPGEGQAHVHAAVDGQPQWTQRSLEDEMERAVLVAGQLGLDLTAAERPWRWRVGDPEQALDVLETLHPPPQGVTVQWPDPKQKRRLKVAEAGHLRVEMASKRDWFRLNGQLTVDDWQVPLEQVLAALRQGRRYVRADDQTVVRLSESLRKRLQPLADLGLRGKHVEVSGVHAELLDELDLGDESPKAWRQTVEKMREAQRHEPQIPQDLRAELRPYQVAGVQWLMRLAQWAPGAVLADDMGLGKTVQALALLLHRRALGPALVVAPLSLLYNWQREADKFAPALRFRQLHELDDGDLSGLMPGDVVVSSWDRMVRRSEQLQTQQWSTLVFDEAQALKNATTKRAQAAFALQGGFRVALSGTPVENRTSELWSLLRAAVPGLLGSWEDFRERFAGPIERTGDKPTRQALSRLVRPFLLRRRKREVAPELPPRTEIRLDVQQGSEEQALYEAHRRAAVLRIEEARQKPPEARRFAVLAELTRLRQLACHPRLVDPSWTARSAKLEALVERLVEVRAEGHRALVFSQFVGHLTLVREALIQEGFALRYLDGQTPQDQRRAEVDAFQAGDGDAFLISLKAGGTGLNLTAATYVFHLDPWWNPAVEDQATDRAHRIGQHRAVTVYRLVTQATVEDGILKMHADKRQLVEDLLEGTGAAAAIGVDELERLVLGELG